MLRRSSFCFYRGQGITRAAPTCGIADENAPFDECLNTPQRRVRRALRQLGVLRVRELAFKPVEQPVQDDKFAVVPPDACEFFRVTLPGNAAGATVKSTDAQGNWQKFENDAVGHLVRI